MRVLIAITGFLMLSACGQQAENFARGGGSRNQPPEQLNPPPSHGSLQPSKALKLSPGAVAASGTQFAGRIGITATNLPVKGMQFEGRLSVSNTRND